MANAYASLDDIDNALMLALTSIGPSNGGPFVTVGRWVGPVAGALAVDAIEQEVFGRTPSALLAFETEVPKFESTTLSGEGVVLGTSAWTVLVAVSDPRSTGRVVKGTSGGVKGALALAHSVLSVCNDLIVPAPAAILTFTATGGTPNAVCDVSQMVLAIGTYRFSLGNLTTVTNDGTGAVTFNAMCVTTNALGNFPTGTTASGAGVVPAALGKTITVTAVAVQGIEGLWKNQRVYYGGTRVVAMVPGTITVMGVRFTAMRRIEEAVLPDEAVPITMITGSLHLKDQPGAAMQTEIITPLGPFPNGFGYQVTINGILVGAADAVDLAHACTFIAGAINANMAGAVTAVASATNVTVYTPAGHATTTYAATLNVTVAAATPTVPQPPDPIDQFRNNY